MKVQLAHLKVDESLSPRKRIDAKHVDEFVELAGEWPPVLVRPIQDPWYTHQLVGGFHRTAAAEKLGHTEIEARVEVMDDWQAMAAALRDNATHGLPLSKEEKRTWILALRRSDKTLQDIAEATGVSHKLVAIYDDADRVAGEICNITNAPAPNLTLGQSEALARLVPSDTDKRRSTPTGPRLVEDPKREAARAQVPTIAKVAADKKLPPPVVSALADAALAEPELAAELVKRVEAEPMKPEAIRTAAKTLADHKAPQEVKRHNVTPGALIQTQDGVSMADLGRVMAEGEAMSPHAAGVPFADALVKLSQCVFVKDEAVQGWLDTTAVDKWEHAEYTLTRIQEWAKHAQELFRASRRASFQVVGR